MLMRMTRPSLEGVTPRSDFMMAFSMAAMALVSYGCTTTDRESGAEMPAMVFKGVMAP